MDECMLLRVGVKEAAHRVEFTEIDCENLHITLRAFGVEIVA